MSSKKLIFNPKSKRQYLNFGGKVNMSSCKNCQLIIDSDMNSTLNTTTNMDIKMQFGKLTENK